MSPDLVSSSHQKSIPQLEPWTWTKKREDAAKLMCQGVSDVLIARKLNVNPRSIARWKDRDEFNERRTELMAELTLKVKREFLANKSGRIQSLVEDFNALSLILNERGIDCEWLDEAGKPRKSGAPGGSTGYLAREYQSRDTADVMHEGKPAKVTSPKAVYKFDSAIMRERRELRKQIAIELGEWGEVKIPDSDRLDEVLAVLRFAQGNQGNDDADG
jgi:hypothetical protein